ncbi:ubiquitin-associated domain-containing protein 1 [Biomphalaria glabrata]|uniref:Ubiquitin-associated domain-containing protein 1-like n=1 Tax=Biomphalaria glabrata TaxID=6526 RepID=A0A9W3BBB5_BIOGL|nr:ubiquitin-associated domain-containing protein 1-like [Biomphalaria glabrata]XP_055896727.1 ubiquitin-associated domain-containing protein 1-like [Biomphalaria glabrata]KAI8748512.1 ubiquitin-associated domain-containing protein 1-like [Biomphalaria glabrata]
MVVTDSFLFPPSAMMKVRVTNMNGVDTIVDVGKDWTCDKVKLALEHLLDLPPALTGLSADPLKNSLMFKLVLVRTGKTLFDEGTLAQQGVREFDELLLLRKRMNVPHLETERQRDEKKAPDISTIRKATAHLPKKNHDLPEEEPTSSLDFQSELRRILISLIEASQRVLCLNPEAAKIFQQAEDMLNEAPTRKTGLSEANIKQLTDMGFPAHRAKKSLLLNQQSVTAAMEWLLANESDPDIDKPLPGEDNDEGEVDAAPSEPTVPESDDQQGATGGAEGPRFKNILETIRAFQRREFRPNPIALQNLLEMGFAEKEAIHALRLSRNSQEAACDWLLSDKKERPDSIDQGLDPNSPVYKAILAHPSVQLGLNSPRCLLAFLQMLENPITASQWLNDPETGPLLMQISRIYHSEKLTPFNSEPSVDTDS